MSQKSFTGAGRRKAARMDADRLEIVVFEHEQDREFFFCGDIENFKCDALLKRAVPEEHDGHSPLLAALAFVSGAEREREISTEDRRGEQEAHRRIA
jgi:hypothetical protein